MTFLPTLIKAVILVTNDMGTHYIFKTTVKLQNGISSRQRLVGTFWYIDNNGEYVNQGHDSPDRFYDASGNEIKLC